MTSHDKDRWARDRAAEHLMRDHRRAIAGTFTHKMRSDLRIRSGDNLEPVADAIDEIGVSLISTMETAVIVAVKHQVAAIVDRKMENMIYLFTFIEVFQLLITIIMARYL